MQQQEAEAFITRIIEENFEMRARLDETAKASEEMSLQFRQMKTELEGARKEIETLRKLNQHLTGIQTLAADELFGRSTEKTRDILNGVPDGQTAKDPIAEDGGQAEDPITGDRGQAKDPTARDREQAEDPIAGDGEQAEDPITGDRGQAENPIAGDEGQEPDQPTTGDKTPKGNGDGRTGRKSKEKGKREKDLSGLPTVNVFDYDIEQLNEMYGEGNWRFAYWHMSRSVELIRRSSYVQNTYTPVVSVGLEHELYSIPNTNAVLPKSIVSSSLLAEILNEKFGLFLPAYRMEHDDNHFGFQISRQTMVNWINRSADELFHPVYDFQRNKLCSLKYQQCDETTYRVIMDGRAPGSVSYIWTHRSSELMEGPSIIVHCYEKTRAASHLLEFYKGQEGPICLTSDAYIGYHVLQEAMPGVIISCGCFMHARRKFVDAFKVLSASGRPDGLSDELPEVKAIKMIRDIYVADEALKGLTPKERQSRRDTEVRPLVDAYFEYIHSLDPADPLYTEKLREAIQYSLNEEERLRRFLEDGSIPLDDGATLSAL